MTESSETPTPPLPGDGPPQSIPPAAGVTPLPPESTPPVRDTGQERTFAMLCHLTAFAALIGIPFGNIIGPLVIWLIKRDEFPLVDDQGKESLNFQISATIYAIVSAILILVIVGIFLLIALAIFWLVVVIMACVRANQGERFRYPLTIRFIS
jgi:uncharacterized Tic20 family protein